MEYNQILELVKEVGKAGLSHFEYTEGNLHFSMSCPEKETVIVAKEADAYPYTGFNGAAAPVPAMQGDSSSMAGLMPQTTAVVEKEVEETGLAVKCPLVGTFYVAPSEDAQPFVQVGDTVKKGQTIAIVEAMKLMNEIESECNGVVKKILVDNGQPVEYGQPLFIIEEA